MNTEATVSGTLNVDGSLVLHERPTIPAGPVTVVIRTADSESNSEDLSRLLDEFAQRRKDLPLTDEIRNRMEMERERVGKEFDDDLDRLAKLQARSQ